MIDDILLFVKVVEAGSILALEQKSSTPRSTISRRISGLETRIGKLLLVRTPRGMVLTEEGNLLYEHFKSYEQRFANILEINDDSFRFTGRLNVLLPTSIISEILIPNLSEFRQKYPRIELNILQDFKYFNMKNAFYDLAIIDYSPLQLSQKIKKAFVVEKIFVCTPQYIDHYGLWDDFNDSAEHIIARRSCPDGMVDPYLKITANQSSENVKIKHSIAFSSFFETKLFAMNHLGIAEVPLYTVQREIAAGQLIRLFPNHQIDDIKYSLLRNIDENNSCYLAFINFLNRIFNTYFTGTNVLVNL
jgi:DNA-binding transcriptional LysR family regulator